MSFLICLVKPIAYISLPVILLRSSPVGQYYTRAGLYLSTLTMVATCGVALAAGMASIGRRFDVNYVIARTFYALASRVLDLTVQVEGVENLENNQPAVLMANHQSMLDILVVGKLMPKRTSIMAKQSLQFSPLGPFMTLSGAIFVNRANNTSAVRSLAAAAQKMKSLRLSLWMFPEGTRRLSPQPDVLPLKKGGFHLAVQAGIPIVPIVTENYWRIYRPGWFDKGTLRVRVLPPIPTAGLTAADIPDLANRVRDAMLAAHLDLSNSSSLSSSTATIKKVNEEDESKTRLSAPTTTERQLSTDSIAPFPGAYTSRAHASRTTPTPSSVASASASGSPAVQIDRTASLSSVSSMTNSDTGNLGGSFSNIDTEDDEGMVLVGRP
ncbi:hypothetical protein AX16_007802 [Volvariella volvacea WC 439]|nr:hypothetical protein AX16_007802 [Volvariella volvacea WC 439]